MRNRLNSEGHDESQYIQAVLNPISGKMEKPPIVNAFRAAKGDIFINPDDKNECPSWMPRILNLKLNESGKAYLDDDALHTCKRVERAALSAMAALGVSSLRCFLSGDGRDISSLAEYDPFKALLTGLLPKYSTALLWVVCDERNRGNIPLALKIIGTITQAIALAKNILDDSRESAIM